MALKRVEIDHIDTSSNGIKMRLVFPFGYSKSVTSISKIETPGMYGGVGIFNPNKYGTDMNEEKTSSNSVEV